MVIISFVHYVHTSMLTSFHLYFLLLVLLNAFYCHHIIIACVCVGSSPGSCGWREERIQVTENLVNGNNNYPV